MLWQYSRRIPTLFHSCTPLFLARGPDSFLFWIVPHCLGSDANPTEGEALPLRRRANAGAISALPLYLPYAPAHHCLAPSDHAHRA
jgi:hypothetical protein